MYKHQIKMLVESGYRVVALDMLGYGQSAAPSKESFYTYKRISSDIDVLLKKFVGVDKAVFLAHDWGSMFMWHIAKYHPSIVDGLISLCVPIYSSPSTPVPILDGARVARSLVQNKNPYTNYQISLKKSDNKVLDTSIQDFLEAFLQEDPSCLERLSKASPYRGIVENFRQVKCIHKLAVDNQMLQYMLDQFAKSGTRGPTNYYRTAALNLIESQRQPPGVEITQPTLYVRKATSLH
ncbi:Bifunctional epoxide hydrolase 2 [Entomophthora muscae]|uniref:Bifunctional epoxide hydrolase 2 n=1 Tax=Entomophthora muscae TaxID=34485 RepID=A0ACC2USM2_9FUNG|nr:Bifunctional epoxide hydrolase 2 [Entomophthora muscae]